MIEEGTVETIEEVDPDQGDQDIDLILDSIQQQQEEEEEEEQHFPPPKTSWKQQQRQLELQGQPLLDGDDEDVDSLVSEIERTRDRFISRSELPPLDDEELDPDIESMSKAEIEALIDELEAGGLSVDMIGAITGSKSGNSDIISRLEKQFKDIVAGSMDDNDKVTDEGDSFIAEILGRAGSITGGGYEDVVEEYYDEGGVDIGLEQGDEDRAAELEARLARIEEMLKLTEMGLDDD